MISLLEYITLEVCHLALDVQVAPEQYRNSKSLNTEGMRSESSSITGKGQYSVGEKDTVIYLLGGSIITFLKACLHSPHLVVPFYLNLSSFSLLHYVAFSFEWLEFFFLLRPQDNSLLGKKLYT